MLLRAIGQTLADCIEYFEWLWTHMRVCVCECAKRPKLVNTGRRLYDNTHWIHFIFVIWIVISINMDRCTFMSSVQLGQRASFVWLGLNVMYFCLNLSSNLHHSRQRLITNSMQMMLQYIVWFLEHSEEDYRKSQIYNFEYQLFRLDK